MRHPNSCTNLTAAQTRRRGGPCSKKFKRARRPGAVFSRWTDCPVGEASARRRAASSRPAAEQLARQGAERFRHEALSRAAEGRPLAVERPSPAAPPPISASPLASLTPTLTPASLLPMQKLSRLRKNSPVSLWLPARPIRSCIEFALAARRCAMIGVHRVRRFGGALWSPVKPDGVADQSMPVGDSFGEFLRLALDGAAVSI